jgi:hypothetical protein
MWADPADDHRARVGAQPENRYAPWATGDVYLNFIGDEGHDRTVAGYGPENYQRLARIKAEFDPDNIFSRWHNVKPHRDGNPAADAW